MKTLGQQRLSAYVEARKVRQYVFAQEIDATPASVSRWLSGETKPSDDMKLKLEDVTGGDVMARDWLVPAKEDAA